MPLDGTFPKFIEFINDHDVLVREQVKFEWKLIQCSHCHMLGHDVIACKKKGVIRQEWRVVHKETLPDRPPKQQPNLQLKSALDPQNDGFTSVPKKAIAKHGTQSSHSMISSDFNSMLYKEDRIGGNEINDTKVKDFANCVGACELAEMRSIGTHFSWTNKTIWSRIDRFHDTPKPHSSFQYCNIWSSHKDFPSIVASIAHHPEQKSSMYKLQNFLNHLKLPLRKLNKDNFVDLYE
ncbi:hypothetical protein Cgig2_012538 [Carnegiea gigantea]|uniref:Uncharacterized protein n=1 Tax=Carnegiea gigantea TaxID=171969 RepID=A0A9Q1JJH1_9CARY|nr:hypothetical protein Cgig2_012538 [Carnegiea gigantea]